MASIFADIRDGLRDGIDLVVKKTGELTKMGKLNIELIGIRREIEELFSELGGRTFEIITKELANDIASDSEVMQLVKKLQELEAKLQDKKTEVNQVKKPAGDDK